MPNQSKKLLKMENLIDIGVNLLHRSFTSDREAVVDRAAAAGVTPLILTGTSLTGSLASADYAAEYPGRLYATAGVHPHHAKDWTPESADLLRELAVRPEVVAVGECGLDFFRNFSPPAAQEYAFTEQLRLAAELNMPVFLHERDAHPRFGQLLRPWLDQLPGVVVHCFTGKEAALRHYLDLDCYIGITGWVCDERRGKHLLELLPLIPDDRLLLETDAPFLTPRDLPGAPRRNEPVYLPHILHRVAAARGQQAEDLARVTTANARRFFGLSKG